VCTSLERVVGQAYSSVVNGSFMRKVRKIRTITHKIRQFKALTAGHETRQVAA